MNNNVYIPSIEASDIWSHVNRGNVIKLDYTGMIPNSLLLMKLKEQGEFETFAKSKANKKFYSNSVINVKFEHTVQSGEQKLESIKNTISEIKKELKRDIENEKLKGKQKYFEELKTNIENNITDPKWSSVSTSDLRKHIYKEGFRLNKIDFETGEIILEKKYKFLGRSSSKSRKGECWFIDEDLHEIISKWIMMEMRVPQNEEIDLAGLMSYSMLCSSSIEDTVEIDPESILMVDKVISRFKEDATVVVKVKEDKGKERLECRSEEKYEFENEIFDGEALLDTSVFEERNHNVGFYLLRQSFFKAAAFNFRVQQFLIDYAKENGIDFDSWYIEDMFGNKIKADKIKMIVNPSCFKGLKYSELVSNETIELKRKNDMWQHFLKQVKSFNNLFGICKYEKPSQRSIDDSKVLNQLSYQMLNTLPANKEQVAELSQIEINYINDLKNNDNTFIDFVESNITNVNANQMFVDLYRLNKDIVKTKIFRDFRKKQIHNHVNYVKSGKIRLEGDNTVMLSSPVEYMYKVVGEIGDEITESMTLKGNEIHTTLFGDEPNGEIYTAFRSPHSSPSNIIQLQNVWNKLIEKYCVLTPNIVVINVIGEANMDRLSGADFDSDQILIIKSDLMQTLSSKCYKNDAFEVCVNKIPSDDRKYFYTPMSMAEIDNELSSSQSQIGTVTNLAQLAMSMYYDELNNGKPDEAKLKALYDDISILTVLSGIAIDSSKRRCDVKINKVINSIRIKLKSYEKEMWNFDDKCEVFKEGDIFRDKKGRKVDEKKVKKVNGRPLFWKYVENDKINKIINKDEDNDKKNTSDTEDKKEVNKPKIKHYGKYDTPMDFLQAVIAENVCRADNKSSIKTKVTLKDLLEVKDHRKGNRGMQRDLESIAKESNSAFASIKLSGLDEDIENIKLEEIQAQFEDKFSKKKVNEYTMYAVIKRISEETESKDKQDNKVNHVRLMNYLYRTKKKMFLSLFRTA